MFESVIASILNNVLGKYIKDLDSSNLRLGILKGNVVLTDLELRDDALDGFHLPVEVTHGFVGKICLTIPWTNPYSEPYEITVHDVYLIAGPIRDRKYVPERAKASEIAAKRKRLAQIDQRVQQAEGTTVEEKPTDDTDGSDSFVDKLVAQVVKNLKVSVKNIHFRYEDKVTSPKSPFAVGFTLENLSAETTNELWQECVVEGSARTVYKIVSLDCLSVYWNTNQKSDTFFGTSSSWKKSMSQGVSRKGSIPSDYQFILKPLSAECHVIMDQSSEILLDTPKLLIEVLQQELSLVFSQNQFHNLMDMIESFELMTVNQMYLKYQPTLPVRVNPSAWWKYAYTAICEEKIRCWTWARIKEHRRKYKLYKELWKEKLKGFNEDERASKLSTIQSLEDKLDIPSILIARKHAELEVPLSQRYNPNKKPKSSPWWAWLGIGSASSSSSSDQEGATRQQEEEEDIWSKFSVAALPADEKEKLYKAIDYNENVRMKYPTEFIKSRVTFNLDKCSFVLCDTTNCEIAQLDTEGFEASLEHRPTQSAFRFHAKINSFKMLGSSEAKDTKPCLVSSKTSLAKPGTPLVQCTLETKPLKVKADYAVSLKVEPVEATYDSHTVDKIVSFVSMPENTKLKELEVAAAKRLQELRMWTRAGLEYAITQHEITYLDIDVRSPFVVIPEYGTLQRDGSVLAIDLGHLTVVSNLASRDSSVRKASDHELEEMFYDKFEMRLDDIQVMIIDKGLDWKSSLGISSSRHHILPSTALTIQLQKSITSDNAELPQFKLSSVLPALHLKLSDEKFKMLMKFLDHLPVGVQQPSLLEEKQAEVLSKREWKRSSSTLSLEEASDLQAVVDEALAGRLNSIEEDEEWYDAEENLPDESPEEERPASRAAHEIDKIRLAGTFTVEKLVITVDKASEQSAGGPPYLSLEIRALRADLIVHTWDVKAQVKLGFIQLLDNHWKDIDGSNLCVLTSSSTKDWITIDYIKADPTGPEFHKFHSVEQLMEVRFSSLRLTAKQEAIASFQIFVLSLFQSTGSAPDWAAVPQRILETITEEDNPIISVATKVADEKPQSDSDIVNFKIVALIEDVTVILSSMGRHVGRVDVEGLDVKVDVFAGETNVTTMLKDFRIDDITEGTLYPHILDLADNTVFECKVTIFNKTLQGAIADQDPTALDFSVDVKLGKLRFVFLGYFVAHLQNFIQALVSPETVAYAQEVTQKVVLNQVQYIQKQGAKIGLKISVNAPQIVIPCNSRSNEKLVADLGQLHVTNSIVSSSKYGLIDKMDVRLSSFQISGYSQVEKHLSQHLIEPVELNVIVQRRLNLEEHDLPLIEVEGNLELFKVNLGISDFQMLMMVINYNLLEGQHERQPAPKSSELLEDEEQKEPAVGRLDRTDASSIDEVPSVRCIFTLGKVHINSPKIIDGIVKPYLVLETKDMSATVTMETWILNASAKLGAIELLDHLNTEADGSPVKVLSSSRDVDLISVSYKRVDPRCPEFESTYCTIEQQISVTFSKLKIDCLQKTLMDLQMHGLDLISSIGTTAVVPAPDSQSASQTAQKTESTVSVKVEAALSEVDVLLRLSHKNLAEIRVRGLTAEFLLWENGLLFKSRQKDLSVVDLNTASYYPKIISVENENVFDFEFKYFNNAKPSHTNDMSPAELTKPDGNLELNIGKINIVFLYRFITELMQFVEPLTSPQSTQYVQDTAQKAVTEQIETIQSQGTRIGLQVAISAPLVIIPRHSHSVDMLLVDLGHLELQNEFDVLPLPKEHGDMEAVFDVMELSLQSVQLSRGVMDLSSSAVIKRYLIEPIKLDATVKRSLLPSGHDVPIIECAATLDFVKMNLGQHDYHVLTTLFQENLKESYESYVQQDHEQPSERVTPEQAEHVEPSLAADTSTEPELPDQASDTVWDQMVFSFDLAGASLTLNSNERPLDPFDSQSSFFEPATRLCLCEVEKSVVTVVLPSDNSVQIHGVLNGCVVEDVRQGTISAFPRLLDKKIASYSGVGKSSPPQEMCDVVFCQLPSGEMKVDISLQNATIFVNFPFLLPLLEFFTTTPPDLSKQRQRTTTASQTSLDATPVSILNPEGTDVPRHPSRGITAPERVSQVDAAAVSGQVTQMKIFVHGVVKEPDIVLLSDATRGDSEALIVQAEVEFDYNMENEKQSLSANLTKFQMQASQFPDVERTSYKVLNPCSLTFNYLMPASSTGGQDIVIELEEMMFEFSPALLTTVSNVVTAFTSQHKVDEGVQTTGQEVIAAPTDLWDSKPASPEYWYKKKATEDSKPKLVNRKSTGDKLSVVAKEVQVVLVNEIEGAHVPLLLVRSFMKAKAADWSAQLKVEADVAVQMSYYNESLAAWEPLLEPVVVEQEKTMWEVQLKLFLAEGYVSSFSPKDVDSCDGPPRDLTDGSKKTPLARDVTDSGFRSLTQRRSTFRRMSLPPSLRCTGRQRRPGKKARRRSTGTTSADEDDLDYEGAMSTFVHSTERAFSDPSSEYKGLDVVDAPLGEVDAESGERESQATYIVINSHDVMQLTVTPTAVQILSELSQQWTTERTKQLRTVPGPTFVIHNQLGIHAAVTVSPKHQISDGNQLTVRPRIVKLPTSRLSSLADAAPAVVQGSPSQGFRRILSEPLFNRLREKLHKIRRKRASSEPISLEAIRQRKFSLQNTTSFQVGQPPRQTKVLRKGLSVDSGMDTDGRAVTLPPPVLSSSESRDHTSLDGAVVKKTSGETLTARPPPEEQERGGDSQLTADNSASVGLAGTHVSHTIANIGSMVGGIFAPHQDATSKGKQSESTATEPDVAVDDDNILSLTVDGFYNVSFISIARSGSYLHKLSPKDAVLREANHKWFLVVQVEIKKGRKTVTIRSPLQIQNHLQVPVDVFVKRKASSESTEELPVKLFTVEPAGTQNVPLYTAYNEELFVKPSDANYNLSSTPLSWRKFTKEDPSCVLACSSSSSAFYIKALCQADSLNKLPSDQDSPHHVIHLYPPLVVHNKLPFELDLSTQDKNGDEVILPGDKASVVTLCPGDDCQMTVTMKNYKEASWIGHLAIKKEHVKSLILLMKSQEEVSKDLLLGVLTLHQSGTKEMFIYSPYWLINKTGLHVDYRVSKTKQIYVQSAVEKHPLLFNFTGKSYRKAKLRLPGHPWSSKFSLDAVGDSGKVTCKTNDGKKFEFILQIEMSRTGLTKIVTLTPKYVIINNTEISLSFIENKCKNALWFVVEPGESKPFWPIDKSSAIVLKPTMRNFLSKPFTFSSSHTTVLRIAELHALTVDVHGEVEDSVTTIVVTPYSPGVGTIRIENLCDNIPIRFHQKDSGQVTVLYSKHMILYTWDEPLGVRKLFWKPYTGVDKPVEVLAAKDGFGELRVELDESSPPVKDERKQLEDRDVTCGLMCGSSAAVPGGMDHGVWDDVDNTYIDNVDGPMMQRVKKTIYWVSVMDGLQRVLIFTDNEDLSCLARKCCDYEVVNMELFMSLDGVGLSLVNNKPDEVAYITLSSSSSIWQVERSTGKWKTLNLEMSTWLEDAWRNNAEVIDLEDREVDFNSMRMTRPYRGAIRRLFEPALWFNYTSSDHYHSLHCKMHRIQIDNQQIGSVFPVALYPSPLPSSVIRKSGFKPFIEVSVIYHQVPKEGMLHIKYAKALVQEMNVKLDKGFIISVAGLFSQQKELLEEENYFEEDMKRVAVPLRETEAVKAALETQKVFLEFFHLSPLKINLSFSLASSPVDEEDEEQAFARDLWDFFVDSIGATLTDINDAELRLAYFERVSVFLTQENLVSQIRQHYTMQGVRQVYVLVLGLDVLGNPYALIHGIGEGVKDFFYEPYQGIIAGPGEFAEGVARGVKSLLGHVIGGTAGAFSKITGSLGQAVATLTFDSNFQMRRRLRMHREPHGIGQGLIMGGKSLLMGLFFGVSGVVVKPVEGARSEGVEGFFKGIGKGLLGLLTHPAGGVIDMVSFTLDGVRRSAELNGEDIVCRARLPRFTAPNKPLRPYSEHDAKGNGILKSLDQPDDVYVDHMSVTGEESSFVILLTDRRIFHVYQSKFWLGWKVKWSCLYEDIAGFPSLTANSLVIKQKPRKQDVGSTVEVAGQVYEIVSADKSELEALKSKIDNYIRHYL